MPPYSRALEVRWSDLDANGHVRNSVYSELGTDVRMAWLRDGGFPWTRFGELGLGPVLLREEIEYLREIGGGRVRGDLEVLGLSADGGRWKLRHGLYREDGVLAARVVVAGGWIDHASRRLVVPPEPLAELLRAAQRAEGFEELPRLRRAG